MILQLVLTITWYIGTEQSFEIRGPQLRNQILNYTIRLAER